MLLENFVVPCGCMKTVKFRSYLAEMILRGEKTTTFRLFDDKDLKEGDTLEMMIWGTQEVFVHAKVTSAYDKKLGELTTDDFTGHEPYADEAAMYAAFREYYGDHVGPETTVRIVRFILNR